MGLMFLFPTQEGESDHILIERKDQKKNKVSLITYGLPGIFWAYGIALWTVIFFLALAVHASLQKLSLSTDIVDKLIVSSLYAILFLLPLSILGLLLYEKRIIRTVDTIQVLHRPFLLTLLKFTYPLSSKEAKFKVEHFLESANMARLENKADMRAFQNKGHYQLVLEQTGKKIILDRHSLKTDLDKIKGLLEF